jgi:hypothetical protein
MTSKDLSQGGGMVAQILLVIGLSRCGLSGLLVLLGLECKILLGVGSLLACMMALEEIV